ncbi:MAG TPA: iron-sulfur cluster-binding protein [Ruminiclostridium sp.]|nr:iron-sulfur cluster-binding protein [Ruminiclostridium sp.]
MSKLYIANGTQPKKMTIDLLERINPLKGKDKDIRIGIKPNLVCASPAEEGATTHPEIVEGIIIYLTKIGFNNIKIIEGAWVGDSTKRAYKVCGYEDISRRYGIPLIDLKDDGYVTKVYKGMELKICKTVFEIDYLINVPLIKGHCQTRITCALKNLKGIIPDSEKRRFHTMGLHKPIAYLNAVVRQDLIIADGICPDPYFEEGGRPVKMNRIAAGFDPVLMDSYAAKVLGYKTEDIKYIVLAESEGIGRVLKDDNDIVNIYEDSSGADNITIVQKEKKYLNMIEEADACSACYSNLVSALEKLDELGATENIADQICIGQAYRGYKGILGVGDCTSCFEKYMPGCPPSVDDIIKFFTE